LRESQLRLYSDGLVGLDFAEDVLKRLGMGVERRAEELEVLIPTWRSDVTEEIDLVEETLRLYGFNRIPSSLPRVTTGDVRKNVWVETEDQLRDLLRGCGLTEVVTYSFIRADQNKISAMKRR